MILWNMIMVIKWLCNEIVFNFTRRISSQSSSNSSLTAGNTSNISLSLPSYFFLFFILWQNFYLCYCFSFCCSSISISNLVILYLLVAVSFQFSSFLFCIFSWPFHFNFQLSYFVSFCGSSISIFIFLILYLLLAVPGWLIAPPEQLGPGDPLSDLRQ